MLLAPDFLLLYRVPGDQAAEGLLLGGWLLISMPVFQPVPDWGWPGLLGVEAPVLVLHQVDRGRSAPAK
jgi:hypothetical protein